MNVVVLHGPNLNLLGEREGDEPSFTLDKLNEQLRAKARVLEMHLRIYQSNHEGALLDHLHAERRWADAFVLNPGALTHYSYSLRDAIAAVRKPCIEVHLSDPARREAFRKTTVLADVVQERIVGKGVEGYLEAFEVLDRDASAPRPRKVEALAAPARGIAKVKLAEAPPPKTIGRKAEKEKEKEKPAPAKAAPVKSVGRIGARKASATHVISRAAVREKIAGRLSGELSLSALCSWARSHWSEVQGGAATEVGQRELLEDTLQQLMLASQPAGRLSDDQLVELMTQLE